MRTRARGAASPPLPGSPLRNVRRKRSSTLEYVLEHGTAPGEHVESRDAIDQESLEPPSTPPPSTPRKSKRVRFSDPGPIQAEAVGLAISNTGLTPHMNRTTLDAGQPSSIRLAGRHVNPNRRVSLPAVLTDPSSPIVQKIQFEPLRQILDQRMRRRLRRSHLSEEMNTIAEQKKEEAHVRQEVQQLRAQGGQQGERIKELMFELETQRQLGISVNAEEAEHVQALEDECVKLREELSKYNMTSETSPTRAAGAPKSSPAKSRLSFEIYEDDKTSFDLQEGDDDDDDDDDDQDLVVPDSPSQRCIELHSISPRSSINSKHDSHDSGIPSPVLTEPDTPATQAQHATILLPPTAIDLGASLRSLAYCAAGTPPASIITALKAGFRSTRYQLESLLPGETTIGLENTKDLMPTLLDHIQSLKNERDASRNSVDAVHQTEAVLRANFNVTLEKLEHADNDMTILHAENESLMTRLQQKDNLIADLQANAVARIGIINARDEELQTVQTALETASANAQTLTATHGKELADYRVSIQRLQGALNTYREESEAVLALLTTIEAQKDQTLLDINALRTNAADTQDQLITQATRYQGALDDKSNELRSLEHVNAGLRCCLSAFEIDKLKRIHVVNALHGQVADLQERIVLQETRYEGALEDKDTEMQALESQNAGLRALLASTRSQWQGQILRTRRSLGGMIEEFEKGCEDVKGLVLEEGQEVLQESAAAA
ncbi:MAG: hypothetical protein M1828_002281 [Chrysothrix sp. TS-e1954]|nr:MAG: hypothetical protein M1828_002281 [Chrysothrix sp. TS-e1954]